MRLPLVLLLCLCGLQGTVGKEEGGTERQAARLGRDRAVPSSGELTSKENHRCTWETSGEAQVTLLISCSHGDQLYWCRYVGRPDLCPAYGARSSQYWKQAVGRLKKKRNACDGEKVLKTRVCKKAPVESHMRLEEKSGEEEEEEGRKSGRAGGHTPAAERDRKPAEEERDGFREVNDGNMETAPVENYCAEGWQSFCSFFVKFIDG